MSSIQLFPSITSIPHQRKSYPIEPWAGARQGVRAESLSQNPQTGGGAFSRGRDQEFQRVAIGKANPSCARPV